MSKQMLCGGAPLTDEEFNRLKRNGYFTNFKKAADVNALYATPTVKYLI